MTTHLEASSKLCLVRKVWRWIHNRVLYNWCTSFPKKNKNVKACINVRRHEQMYSINKTIQPTNVTSLSFRMSWMSARGFHHLRLWGATTSPPCLLFKSSGERHVHSRFCWNYMWCSEAELVEEHYVRFIINGRGNHHNRNSWNLKWGRKHMNHSYTVT